MQAPNWLVVPLGVLLAALTGVAALFALHAWGVAGDVGRAIGMVIGLGLAFAVVWSRARGR
jgi:hypothetical protein